MATQPAITGSKIFTVPAAGGGGVLVAEWSNTSVFNCAAGALAYTPVSTANYLKVTALIEFQGPVTGIYTITVNGVDIALGGFYLALPAGTQLPVAVIGWLVPPLPMGVLTIGITIGGAQVIWGGTVIIEEYSIATVSFTQCT